MQQHSDIEMEYNDHIFMPTDTSSIRKIGGATFIVTSTFRRDGKGDVISRLSRLMQNDAGRDGPSSTC